MGKLFKRYIIANRDLQYTSYEKNIQCDKFLKLQLVVSVELWVAHDDKISFVEKKLGKASHAARP